MCRKCGKRGHYQKACRTPATVETVQEGTAQESIEPFLGVVGDSQNNPWVATILRNNKPVQFHIDTGAEVTVIPESVSSQISGISLQPAQRRLKGPSQKALPVRGQFTGKLALGEHEVQQEVYVVNKLLKPLLGQPAIEALGLLASEQWSKTLTQFSISLDSSKD